MAYIVDFNSHCLTSVVEDMTVVGGMGFGGGAWVYRSGLVAQTDFFPDGVHTVGGKVAIGIDGIVYPIREVYTNIRMKDWVQVSDDNCKFYSYGNGTMIVAKSCDFDNTLFRVGLVGGDVVSVPKGWYVAHAGDCIAKI